MEFLLVGAWILSLIVVALIGFGVGVGVAAFHLRDGARIGDVDRERAAALARRWRLESQGDPDTEVDQ